MLEEYIQSPVAEVEPPDEAAAEVIARAPSLIEGPGEGKGRAMGAEAVTRKPAHTHTRASAWLVPSAIATTVREMYTCVYRVE